MSNANTLETEDPETVMLDNDDSHEHDCGEHHPSYGLLGRFQMWILSAAVAIPGVGGLIHLFWHSLAHYFGLPCP